MKDRPVDLTAEAAYFSMRTFVYLQGAGTPAIPEWKDIDDTHQSGFRDGVRYIANVEASKSSRPPDPQSVFELWAGDSQWSDTSETDRKAVQVFIHAAQVVMRALDDE